MSEDRLPDMLQSKPLANTNLRFTQEAKFAIQSTIIISAVKKSSCLPRAGLFYCSCSSSCVYRTLIKHTVHSVNIVCGAIYEIQKLRKTKMSHDCYHEAWQTSS